MFFLALFSKNDLSRAKRGSESMSGVLNQLNWRNDTRFVQLGGLFPVESIVPLQDGIINFSAVTRGSDKVRTAHNCKSLSRPEAIGRRIFMQGCNERV